MKKILVATFILALSSPALATSGYDEFISACTINGSKAICSCMGRGLKAKDTTNEEYRHLAKKYRGGKNTSAEEEKYNMLEEFDWQLAEECAKNHNFKVQE